MKLIFLKKTRNKTFSKKEIKLLTPLEKDMIDKEIISITYLKALILSIQTILN